MLVVGASWRTPLTLASVKYRLSCLGITLAIGLAANISPGESHAQRVGTDSTVRVTTTVDSLFLGRLESLDSGAIVMELSNGGPRRVLPWNSVRAAEIGRRRKRGGTRTEEFGIGGFAVGAFLLGKLASSISGGPPGGFGELSGWFVGVPVGGVLGAILGVRYARSHTPYRWEEIPHPGKSK